MKKNIKICKTGNGQSVNLPKAMMEMLGLKIGDEIEAILDLKKNSIILKKK